MSAGPKAWARDIQPLVAAAEAAGWTVERGGKVRHPKFRDAQGRLRVVCASTPRRPRRALANLRAELRRAGLDV